MTTALWITVGVLAIIVILLLLALFALVGFMGEVLNAFLSPLTGFNITKRKRKQK